jgi:hypothetical protein
MWGAKQTPYEPFVGEVYVRRGGMYGKDIAAHQAINEENPFFVWRMFKGSEYEYTKNHDGFLCICGVMHKKENVLWYSDVYKPLKEAIERRVEEERRKKRKWEV